MANHYKQPEDSIDTPLGVEFEGRVINIMQLVCVCKSTLNTASDTYEGTDCFVNGLRCDITLNPYKNNTVYSQKRTQIDLCTVKYGVRTGNGVHKFDEPVMVIEFDVGDMRFLRQAFERVISSIKNNIGEILENAQDTYWNIVDEGVIA